MVSFIGAGPGDPELLTIKGKKLIDSADIIIYAGSLVNPQVLSDAKEGAVIYNSAGMNLEEVLAVMKDGEEKGLKVVRVHTGDPAVYGAHREQMDALERMGIAYEVIPGVSSFLAAAAVLKKDPYAGGREASGSGQASGYHDYFSERGDDRRAGVHPAAGIPGGYARSGGLQSNLGGPENCPGNASGHCRQGEGCGNLQNGFDRGRRFPGRRL